MAEKKAAGIRHTALVTGASSGIGESFARLLARRGCNLVLVARRETRLRKLQQELEASGGVKVHCLGLDLADPACPAQVWQATQALGVEVDTLMNNAGIGLPGPFLATKWSEQSRLIQLMATTPAELIHLYTPAMLKRGYGRIVNVASIGAFLPASPNLSLYGGLKHFLLVMNQTLQEENRGSGVSFTAVCPGPTETELVDNSHQRVVFDQFPKWAILSADKVAEKAYAAMIAGKDCIVTGAATQAAHLALGILPQWLSMRWLRKSYSQVRA